MNDTNKMSLRLLATLSLSLCAVATAQDAGSATRGKELFHTYGCYGCHGFNGETGARDLVATNSPLIGDLATFKLFLRLRGDVAPLLPSTRMPNYPANSLNDADVADIYAYVRLFKLDAPAIDSAPTLQKILQSARAAKPAPRQRQ